MCSRLSHNLTNKTCGCFNNVVNRFHCCGILLKYHSDVTSKISNVGSVWHVNSNHNFQCLNTENCGFQKEKCVS